MTHKSNIVYLQFKLLSTHVRLGGQDGGKDDVREPLRRNRLNKKSVQGGMNVAAQKRLGQVREFKLALFVYIVHIPVYKRGCVNQMHRPVMKFNNESINKKLVWLLERRKEEEASLQKQ